MQMPPLPDGQGKGFYIRGEYVSVQDRQSAPPPEEKEEEKDADG